MLIGVPKEIKTHEYRVGLVPASVRELVHHGHEVIVETRRRRRHRLRRRRLSRRRRPHRRPRREEVFATAEMIVKVKEPQPQECRALREDQILFTYLHLAADRDQTEALMQSGCVAHRLRDRDRPARAACRCSRR